MNVKSIRKALPRLTYWLETSGNASARLIYQFLFSSPTQFGLLMCFSTAYFSSQYTKILWGWGAAKNTHFQMEFKREASMEFYLAQPLFLGGIRRRISTMQMSVWSRRGARRSPEGPERRRVKGRGQPLRGRWMALHILEIICSAGRGWGRRRVGGSGLQ